MLPHELAQLRERLLRGGVAPRHVRRFVRELADHYDDVLGEELEKGAELGAAQAWARARLGHEDELAANMLRRRELRSKAVRFPALTLGAGPTLAWLSVLTATACASRLLPDDLGAQRTDGSAWLLHGAYALCLLYARVLPVLFGLAALVAASQRRLDWHWPFLGAALVHVFAGSLSIHFFAESGQLGVSSSLLPLLFPSSAVFGPKDLLGVRDGLMRALIMLVLTMAAYYGLRRARQLA
jgi:hypothetical protein